MSGNFEKKKIPNRISLLFSFILIFPCLLSSLLLSLVLPSLVFFFSLSLSVSVCCVGVGVWVCVCVRRERGVDYAATCCHALCCPVLWTIICIHIMYMCVCVCVLRLCVSSCLCLWLCFVLCVLCSAVPLRRAGVDQLYQVKRMIGGLGNMLFSTCSHTENVKDPRGSLVNLWSTWLPYVGKFR